MNQPLVTCLCLTTAGRKEWLRKAVDCFNLQTYEQRELIIVADSGWDADCVRELGGFWPANTRAVSTTNIVGPNYSLLVIRDKLNIGEKRNKGCEWAAGDLIAVWDDDDYSAPGRLSQQVAELERTGKSVTGYQTMLFTDGPGWWSYGLAVGFVFGTSLLFRRDWWLKHPFPELMIGEDAGFSWEAHERGELAACPDLGLMYANLHAGNTCKKNLASWGWTPLPGFEWPARDRGALDAWQKQHQ